MREEKVLINGIEVNYKIAGDGPAVLILHGWGGSSGSWTDVSKILAEKGYMAIVVDLPGFGKSAPPTEPWTVDNYTDFVSDFLKKLKIDSCFFLAHSFGGRVSIKFVNRYPEKVKKMIFCASAGIKPRLGLKALLIYFVASIGNAIFTPRILRRFKDSVRNLFYIFLRNKDYVKAKGVMRETIKKVLDEDLLGELHKINIKTLLIWGEKDKMVPLVYGKIFKEKIKDSELIVLPKIGHSPHLEIPDKLSEIILNFIK